MPRLSAPVGKGTFGPYDVGMLDEANRFSFKAGLNC